ncbi:MAG: hypothetical protein ACK48M_09665 [Planctomycetia bacterium]
MAAPHWTLTDHVARAAWHLRDASIDLDRPTDGIAVATPAAGADHLLGIDLRSAARLAERWARGADVTAVYETTDARRLRATAMWRLDSAAPALPREIAIWELVISAQTSRLETYSSLAVVSHVAATDLVAVGAGGVLARRGDGTSALILVHPDDLKKVSYEHRAGRGTISCWLFSSAVEKGVLLRSRVLAAIGPAEGDTRWAAAVAETFAASPPMLTA